ncbi:hypothetical protein [Actinoplanes sp. NPDC049681]|uniref:hypothetical protein n=1 Tax=Actinoplanes sp. NPDC049681 TaxID=3363905 RepID=UPI0037B0DBD1
MFFGLVSLGLPFAVAVGWTLGTPDTAPPAVSAPGGAGAFGAAPVKATTPASDSITQWPPHAPEPVSVVESVAPSSPSVAPSSGVPSATASGSGAPTLTMPPVPTPTSIVDPPSSPAPAATSGDADPEPSGLAGGGLFRRS